MLVCTARIVTPPLSTSPPFYLSTSTLQLHSSGKIRIPDRNRNLRPSNNMILRGINCYVRKQPFPNGDVGVLFEHDVWDFKRSIVVVVEFPSSSPPPFCSFPHIGRARLTSMWLGITTVCSSGHMVNAYSTDLYDRRSHPVKYSVRTDRHFVSIAMKERPCRRGGNR